MQAPLESGVPCPEHVSRRLYWQYAPAKPGLQAQVPVAVQLPFPLQVPLALQYVAHAGP